jgi:hypothetical protein
MKKKDHFWAAVFFLVVFVSSLLFFSKRFAARLRASSREPAASAVSPVSTPEETLGGINTNKGGQTDTGFSGVINVGEIGFK